jgi:hypothetical protein
MGGGTETWKWLFDHENMCYSSLEAKNRLTSLMIQNMGGGRET